MKQINTLCMQMFYNLPKLLCFSVLSSTIHALSSLLYPFSWQHTFIPVLPTAMLDVVCSPTPYIIGITSNHLLKALTLPLDEVIVEMFKYLILIQYFSSWKCVCFLHLLYIQVHFRLDCIKEANTMNPDQTAPLGVVWSGTILWSGFIVFAI